MFTEVGGQGPAIGAVKVGRLAGRTHLVPLADATFSSGQVRVSLIKDQVAGAPEADDTGQLSRAEEVAYAEHYGLSAAAVTTSDDALRDESSTARRARREAMDADLRRAQEMESEAVRLEHEADDLEARASEAAQHARDGRERQQQLLHDAADLRRAVDSAPDA